MHVCTHAPQRGDVPIYLFIDRHACMHACTDACVHVCTHPPQCGDGCPYLFIDRHACMHACMMCARTHRSAVMSLFIYLFIDRHACMHACTDACVHVCTHPPQCGDVCIYLFIDRHARNMGARLGPLGGRHRQQQRRQNLGARLSEHRGPSKLGGSFERAQRPIKTWGLV